MWRGQRFQFEALPMGLTSSPRIFTKIMKAPITFLRKEGFSLAGYIDDFSRRVKTLRNVTLTIKKQ